MTANENFYDALETCLKRAGNKPAFIHNDGPNGGPNTREVMTYAQLVQRTNAMAGALVSLGVGPGDRVTVQVEKSINNVLVYLATLKIGAIFNPLNTAYTPTELDYFLADAEPALVVVDPANLGAIVPIATARNIAALKSLDVEGGGTLAQLAATATPVVETTARAGDDLASLIYTSGTTGKSKGAMLTHDNLSSNAAVLHDYWGFEDGDVLLHALPIFHVHGLFVALHIAFLNGSTMHWLPKYDADQVMALLPNSTVMMGVPTFYTRLLAKPEFSKESCANIRLFISGSAPMLSETHQEFEARTGHAILERYGMTETGMITSNPYSGAARLAGTVGYPLPGINVRIADEGGAILGSGQIGVLEVSGPNVFKGYWRNEKKTAQEFRDDGFFITGDLSQQSDDGRVTIVGRSKDLIISGGLNVYPKEIEDQLNDLDGILESAVIGIPHSDFGEVVVAVVVAEQGAGELDEDDIIAALGEGLAKFKLPKRIFWVAGLPRNAMGKVQKNELRQQHTGIFS